MPHTYVLTPPLCDECFAHSCDRLYFDQNAWVLQLHNKIGFETNAWFHPGIVLLKIIVVNTVISHAGELSCMNPHKATKLHYFVSIEKQCWNNLLENGCRS